MNGGNRQKNRNRGKNNRNKNQNSNPHNSQNNGGVKNDWNVHPPDPNIASSRSQTFNQTKKNQSNKSNKQVGDLQNTKSRFIVEFLTSCRTKLS